MWLVPVGGSLISVTVNVIDCSVERFEPPAPVLMGLSSTSWNLKNGAVCVGESNVLMNGTHVNCDSWAAGMTWLLITGWPLSNSLPNNALGTCVMMTISRLLPAGNSGEMSAESLKPNVAAFIGGCDLAASGKTPSSSTAIVELAASGAVGGTITLNVNNLSVRSMF